MGLPLCVVLAGTLAGPAAAEAPPRGPGPEDARETPGAPCATTVLRPQPCPLWHGLVVMETAPPAELPRDREGASSPVMTGVVAVAASLAGAALLDELLRVQLVAPDPDDPSGLARLGNHLGNGRYAVLATAGTYAVSSLAGYPELAEPAGRVLAALAATGLVNGTLKATVGRSRPRLEHGSGTFRPFSLDNGWQSFPSGHTATAFAMATAISMEARRTWVTAATFSGAGLVAWSRSHEDRHWASDVVGGALVGTLVAHYTVRHLQGVRIPTTEAVHARVVVGPAALAVAVPVR